MLFVPIFVKMMIKFSHFPRQIDRLAIIRHRIGMMVNPTVRSRPLHLMPALLIVGTLIFAASLFGARTADAQRVAAGCKAPNAVCQASRRVFVISSFDPFGSAVLIEPGVLVTNRHMVADNSEADVQFSDGTRRQARVVPTSFPGDLVLLRLDGLTVDEPIPIAPAVEDQQVYAIGADVGRHAVRVYVPGRVTAIPPPSKPYARVHHSARSQPGNSGGALVARDGTLVAIVSSGGDGRNEAIPIVAFDTLKKMSGPEHLVKHRQIGLAFRQCANALDAGQKGSRLAPSDVEVLYKSCLETGNRQMFDDAGRILGRQRFIDQALDLFRRSLDHDPNGLNTRLSMAITLHVAQRYEEEIPHLKILMTRLPTDPQVLRLAIQAGKWGGDEPLAERAFELLVEHHPQLKPVAERFMNQLPPPRPGGVTPR